MNKWKKTINLSLRWNEDWNDENIHEMGKWVATKIKQAIKDYEDFEKYGWDLEELVERFENISTKEQTDEFNKKEGQWYLDNNKINEFYPEVPMKEFDNCMSELYDLADGYRWWIDTQG